MERSELRLGQLEASNSEEILPGHFQNGSAPEGVSNVTKLPPPQSSKSALARCFSLISAGQGSIMLENELFFLVERRVNTAFYTAFMLFSVVGTKMQDLRCTTSLLRQKLLSLSIRNDGYDRYVQVDYVGCNRHIFRVRVYYT